MYFSELASFFQKLETTDSRNAMTEILADLFSQASAAEIDKICYLCLGRLVPQYESYEFNLAEKLMFEVLAKAYGKDKEAVKTLYGRLGDLGGVAQALASEKGEVKSIKDSTVEEVFTKLWEVAGVEGEGSVEKKINLLAELIASLAPISAKYAVRIPLKKLRLGFSDMTILDSLSFMKKKDKSLRKKIEPFYNISADIGKIARAFKEKDLEGLESIRIVPGTPIRTASAERLPNAEAIIAKIGKCAAEPKYDGFRVQIHKKDQEVHIFSRNLEEMSASFPEISAATKKISVSSIIFEGEAIGFNSETQEFLPFQETVQRKRKYGITEMAKKIPLKVFVFDLFFREGQKLIDQPYHQRRQQLEEIFRKSQSDVFAIAEKKIFEQACDLEAFFQEKISQGLEGVVVKKLDAPYEAGSRGFSWIKYKREEKGALDDTLDCLIMGYYYGRGKRAGFGIGALLVAVYNAAEDVFESIAKIGTGLTDEQWMEIKKECDALKVEGKPARYKVHKDLNPQVWVLPKLVTVVRADEITKSPLHTAGKIGAEAGYALRFPRVMELLRHDKKPEDATTVKEITELYGMQ
ncbi:DNA ligase [candidate division WWE3 bacterium CG_4_8_14_3_um_filter_42_11]|uniref:Probable DNA ligase n=2 Tax=Katanobacteria TaxID=422282 RepID=A0A2M7WYU2_UNCKA|nr:MAG: hypothetical protein AUJ38_00295 [bacterium CG1_02_42_9]PJA38163.1 MAG: DNA ligase [candidate division WWE3 bacterium CG_4_9_14_3_um_filter_43_9]PJC68857.1 MAG: DNA ligase [candidate division WWE3 bacterium CG_4_8_14_3_um_filter_42_11]